MLFLTFTPWFVFLLFSYIWFLSFLVHFIIVLALIRFYILAFCHIDIVLNVQSLWAPQVAAQQGMVGLDRPLGVPHTAA